MLGPRRPWGPLGDRHEEQVQKEKRRKQKIINLNLVVSRFEKSLGRKGFSPLSLLLASIFTSPPPPVLTFRFSGVFPPLNNAWR